jgi:anti-sigma factor RsiW
VILLPQGPRRDCAALAEQRSALVDGSLSTADRERVLVHLVGCAPCRAEVAELRRLRQLLSGSATPETSGSGQLSDRLLAIAGGDASAPLWSRPFSQTRTGSLPRSKRLVKVRTAGSALALVAVLVGTGFAAAPPGISSISDPTDEVRAEFGAMTAELPLASEPVSAVISASRRDLTSSSPLSAAGERTLGATPRALTSAAALAVLRRAADSADQVSYSGTQLFTANVAGRTVKATIQIHNQAGEGTEVEVYNSSGERIASSFTAAASSSRMVDPGPMSLLEDNYTLSAWRGGQVAHHSATVVEATNRSDGLGRSSTGSVAARWWIDDESGLLLWFETYDPSGVVAMSAGFTGVHVGKPNFIEHLPARLSVPMTTVVMTLSSAGALESGGGWTCPDVVAGLSLVRLRSDALDNPSVLHMAYSDGLSTVSVFEQRGGLSGAPDGSEWDAGLGAYVRSGTPNFATWQSGDAVFTVVTDGSPELLAMAVQGLPHDGVPTRTTIERVRAGWARILNSVMG